MPEKPLAALLLLMMLAPLPTAAQELRYLQVAQASRLAAGEHAMFTASCPDDLKIMSGGYKLLASELPMRDLVMVESRPVPELRQWAVTLLYEPSKPAAVPAGEVKLEVWAVCLGRAKSQPGQLSQKRF
jgi:hypothetical protein